MGAPLDELLGEMEMFAVFTLEELQDIPDAKKTEPKPGNVDAAQYWLKKNGWEGEQKDAEEAGEDEEALKRQKRAADMALVVEALQLGAPTGTRGGHNTHRRSWTGDDSNATGAGHVAGVMSGAVGSLQESGFAARRAMSRLVHMQSDNYLKSHLKHRLSVQH